MQNREVVLLSDLDATLFSSDGSISDGNRRAIAAFVRDGGLFGVATGRAVENAVRYLPGVPLNAPSVLLNGAAVYNYETKRYGQCSYLDHAAAFRVIAWCREHAPQLDIQVYTRDGTNYVTPEETANGPYLAIHRPCRFCTAESLFSDDWFKMLIFGEEKAQVGAQRMIREQELDRVFALTLGTTDIVKDAKYFELLPAGVDKGTGVRAIRALPEVAGRRILCIGDYWNDAAMLQEADIAFAPDNAIDEIKAIADHIVPDNNSDALAHVIFDWIPKL